jgi:diaminohydroxyphosphoribosylaminopyrimidine deaminase / 5-amino-6-(5-phosphoribosylamino)uracil reductase
MLTLHETYIHRCLELARQGQGKTHPNPMVGAVVLDEAGHVVGEGFHPQHGGPHAEVVALDQAGGRAQHGTLYVNLEPCNHTGKTPPCTEKILAAGIQTVYFGMRDPNPHVAGQGAAYLQQKGLTVHAGILEAECRKLNEAFCHFVETGRPFVVLKQALTLDGRIATRSGESQWITNESARQWAHQLRSQSDAILTTTETIIKDNSLLTVRNAPLLGQPPIRIILDRHLRLAPEQYRIFEAIPETAPLWIFTLKGHSEHPHVQAAKALGAEFFEVSDGPHGLCLDEVLHVLGKKRITQLLIEAGGRLAGSLLEERLVQKLWLVYGNKLILDPSAKPAFSGSPCLRLDKALSLKMDSSFQLENNLVLETYPTL